MEGYYEHDTLEITVVKKITTDQLQKAAHINNIFTISSSFDRAEP